MKTKIIELCRGIDDVDEYLNTVGYIYFFNNFTEKFLGKPDKHFKNKNEKMQPFNIYYNNIIKNKTIIDVEILNISMMYPSIIFNGNISYSYENFDDFILELIECKKTFSKQSIEYRFIKTYINMCYGLLYHPESHLTADIDVYSYVNKAVKNTLTEMCRFYANQNIPIYYYNVDYIITQRTTPEFKSQITNVFKNIDCLNHDITYLDFEDYNNILFLDKYKYIYNYDGTVRVRNFDNSEILTVNKEDFI